MNRTIIIDLFIAKIIVNIPTVFEGHHYDFLGKDIKPKKDIKPNVLKHFL